MPSNRGSHLVELAHVFAGTPIGSEWAKKGAATRRARAAQQTLPFSRAAELAAHPDQASAQLATQPDQAGSELAMQPDQGWPVWPGRLKFVSASGTVHRVGIPPTDKDGNYVD